MPTKTRESISLALRFYILRRDKFTCQYCGAKAPDAALHIEHMVPVVKGGTNDPDNLCAACIRCNGGKGTQDRDTDEERPPTKRERQLTARLGNERRIHDWIEWAEYARGDVAMKAVLLFLACQSDAAASFVVGLGHVSSATGVPEAEVERIFSGLEAVGLIIPTDQDPTDTEPNSVVMGDPGDRRACGSLHIDWDFQHGGKWKPPYDLSDYTEPLCFSSVERVH